MELCLCCYCGYGAILQHSVLLFLICHLIIVISFYFITKFHVIDRPSLVSHFWHKFQIMCKLLKSLQLLLEDILRISGFLES